MKIPSINALSTLSRHRLSAALIMLVGLSAQCQASAAPTVHQWANTLTRAHNVGAAKFIGNVDDAQPMFVAVMLNVQNEDLLNSYIHELFRPGSPSQGQFMNSKETTNYFAPTQAQAQAVADYLTQQGFTKVQVADNRMIVSGYATARAARQAFHTDFGRFSRNGKEGFANTSPAQIPTQLSGIVQGVLGLQSLDQMHVMNLRSANEQLKAANPSPAKVTPSSVSTSSGTSYYGDEFAKIYHAGTTPAGTGTDVGIIAFDDVTDTIKDLAQFEKDRGITPVPTSVVLTPQGAANDGDDSGEDEWAMDSQAIVGISGGVKSLTFYAVQNAQTFAAISTAINQAVSDNKARVINMSFGAAEVSSTFGNTYGIYDNLFKLGVAQGQTFSASSGDGGAYPDGSTNGQSYGKTEGVEYPASSPYVIAVGGTNLSADANDNYTGETAWAFSGGGVSQYLSQPTWQNGLVPYGTYRNVPDVAFDAALAGGIYMYLTQEPLTLFGFTFYVPVNGYVSNGGTSLSSPLFVGTWARLESANNNKLGFAPPAIYAYAKNSNGTLANWLHDVTSGSNGPGGSQPGYAAGVGYDNVTGWGSFDIQALNTFIGSTPGFITASNSETSSGTGSN